MSCGQTQLLSELFRNTSVLNPGDILILSGSSVGRTASPFALHHIAAFYADGSFKNIVRSASGTELYMGFAISATVPNQLLYTVDGIDRIEKLNLGGEPNVSNHILDANLNGNTLRTVASLSDGGTVVAESPTVIEKFDASVPPARVTTGFPITVATAILKIRRISGDRFVVVTTGGSPDSPRVYSNSGTLLGTISLGLSCGTNCDPLDIVELEDGRFLVSNAVNQSIEIYSANFSRIGQFYRDTTILQNVYAMARLNDGSILACSTTFNTCEKIQPIGDVGTRVGSRAFIDQASVMRVPFDVQVMP